ncbi:MAG: hypothetical protein OEX97_02395, partial [Acidimicrobiia bacterium]|nr:hypothetical protein [Acidimicrobiia bacterium]
MSYDKDLGAAVKDRCRNAHHFLILEGEGIGPAGQSGQADCRNSPRFQESLNVFPKTIRRLNSSGDHCIVSVFLSFK